MEGLHRVGEAGIDLVDPRPGLGENAHCSPHRGVHLRVVSDKAQDLPIH